MFDGIGEFVMLIGAFAAMKNLLGVLGFVEAVCTEGEAQVNFKVLPLKLKMQCLNLIGDDRQYSS